MFRNFLLVMYRNMLRQKGYSFINIAGLSLGITASLLMVLYIHHELGYDRFHDNLDRIYRANLLVNMSGREDHLAITMPPLVPSSLEKVSALESGSRFMPGSGYIIKVDDQTFFCEQPVTVDSTFLDIFSFHLLQGNVEDALSVPNSTVLTRKFADKMFPNDDPLGKIVTTDNGKTLTITGIVEDPPVQSQLKFDLLTSVDSKDQRFQGWGHIGNVYSYFLLKPGSDVASAREGIQNVFDENLGNQIKEIGGEWKIELFPMSKVHLHSDVKADFRSNGNGTYVTGLSVIAIFVLLLASINFINLSTARSAKRAREVGLRKVLGAFRSSLIRQFLAESIVYSILSVLIAIGLVYLLLPFFSELANRELDISVLLSTELIASLVGLVLVVGVVSGSFPAFYLSAFQPVVVLKGNYKGRSGGSWLRRILVVSQFIVSIGLIVATITVFKQIHYLQTKELGFDRDQLAYASLSPSARKMDAAELKNEISRIPGIEGIALSNSVPFGKSRMKLLLEPEGLAEDDSWDSWITFADPDYIPTVGFTLIEGRNFDINRPSDKREAVIINETAAKSLGWEEPLGKIIPLERMDPDSPDGFTVDKAQVIGVMEDFHYASLHEPIEPMIFYMAEGQLGTITFRLAGGSILETKAMLEKKWGELFPDEKFELVFMDERIESQYRAELRFGKIIGSFTVFAIVIALMGLFGLASYAAEVRTKELGIRKVLGASDMTLIKLLTNEFTLLVLISTVIASPLAWKLIGQWLNSFAYRISIDPYIFLLSAITAIVLAWVSVGFQAFKAARSNPVDAIRYE